MKSPYLRHKADHSNLRSSQGEWEHIHSGIRRHSFIELLDVPEYLSIFTIGPTEASTCHVSDPSREGLTVEGASPPAAIQRLRT